MRQTPFKSAAASVHSPLAVRAWALGTMARNTKWFVFNSKFDTTQNQHDRSLFHFIYYVSGCPPGSRRALRTCLPGSAGIAYMSAGIPADILTSGKDFCHADGAASTRWWGLL